MNGVVRTRVGYAGGTTKSPTYHSMGDHTEVVQIDYDMTRVGLKELLEIFWHGHRPRARAYGRQYMSLILCAEKKDQDVAILSKAEYQMRYGDVLTEIRLLDKFHLAEAYHQKYYLRRLPAVFKEVEAEHKTLAGLLDSTEVSRLNGYAGGFGSTAELEADLAIFKLSLEAGARLRALLE